MTREHLHVVYIRPSTYDDEGYVIRFWRGVLPSNTLACLQTLTKSVAENELAHADVTVELLDDTVQRIPVSRIARMRREGTQVVVGFAGVQSNQFERASDLALEFRKAGVQVMMGGFHVSGVLGLFDKPTHELERLLDAGVSLVRGEAEAPGALAAILEDALMGEMKPIYNILDFPDLKNAPVPRMLGDLQKRFVSKEMATIDTSRGCPFNCSFCTIINVQGRKMRYRSSECVLKAIEENHAEGIRVYFFTDDNFSRNPVWSDIFDGLIAMKARGINIIFMMQVDTNAYKIPGFVEKAEKAGCYLAFIGMESVNPVNLEAIGKQQNHVHDYAEMVETYHRHNILVHVGYIIGLPDDTRESVNRDMDVLRNEVKVDFASLFMMVPLPGSKDHWRMMQECVPTDADYNNYDGLHETFKHPKMAPGMWRKAYDEAMHSLYGKENIVNTLLRTPAGRRDHMYWVSIWYRYCTLEGIHPMATGIYRLKDRKSRRPIFGRENVVKYAWRRAKDAVHGFRRYAGMFFEFEEIWMLTREPDDPRWKTLAALRTRWAEVQQHVADCNLRGRYDDAVQELKAMLAAASEHMTQLARGSRLSCIGRRRLRRMVREVESFSKKFDLQLPGWRKVVDAEQYIGERIVAGYEETAIRYVATRRRMTNYRHDFFQRLATGRVWVVDLLKVPYAVLLEILLACRFSVRVFTLNK
ncbi:MAG: radical SAM protein [Candidatus Hydrogenedentes bacterium]|nr:radical SAM protein [Candidatus Hydrogenedentota bacterium]